MNMNSEQPKRVIGLIRVSTAEQAREGRSGIPRQRAAIREACKRFNLELVREVELIDVSGRYVRDDPAFQQLERDMMRPDIQGVATVSLDRVYRPENYSDFSVLDVFKVNRKMIWTSYEQIDANTQSGWFTLIVGGAVAGNELSKLKERCEVSKDLMRARGEYCQGSHTLPKGVLYDKKTRTWSYDPEVAPQVLEAYRLLLAGESYRSMAQKLGPEWKPGRIYHSLRNSLWMGVKTYALQQKGELRISQKTGKRYHTKIRREQIIETRVIDSPLISPAMWQRAQEIMAERRHHYSTRRKPKYEYLSTGHIYCECGKRLYSRRGSGKNGKPVSWYYCSSAFGGAANKCAGGRYYRAADVDSALEKLMTAVLLEKGFLRQIFDKLKAEADKPNAAALRRMQEANRLEAKRKRLIDMHLSGRITTAEFDERVREYDHEKQRLGPPPPEPGHLPQDPVRVIAGIAKAFASFAFLPFEKKRALLAQAVKSISVCKGAIPMVVLQGRFLQELDMPKLSSGSWAAKQFGDTPADLLIRLPQPVEIVRVQ